MERQRRDFLKTRLLKNTGHLRKEYSHDVSPEHWRRKDYKQTVKQKDMQNIMLSQPEIVKDGKVYELQKKHLGAGVWEFWYSKKLTSLIEGL